MTDEDKIIEEIMKDSFQGCNGIMKPECKLNYRTMRKCGDAFYCANCMYYSLGKALEKGKETRTNTIIVTLEKAIDRDLCPNCIPWAKTTIQLLKSTNKNDLNRYIENFDLNAIRRYAMELESEIKKLKEERKQIADELETIKEIMVPDENTILRDAENLVKHICELNKIIKKLRDE